MEAIMIRLCSVWKRERENGEVYYKGRLGDTNILLFKVKNDHPEAPYFDVCLAKRDIKQENVESSD